MSLTYPDLLKSIDFVLDGLTDSWCGHYMWQLMWKGDKKWKCVKLVGSNNAYKRFKIH